MKSWLAVCLLSFAAAAHSAAEQGTQQLDVMEFRVLGNTLLPAVEVEKAVYAFAGPGKTFEDIESARQSLESTYRRAGYSTVYVDIPEQDVDAGIVRLKVTESRLNVVRIEGAKYFSARRLRAALPGAVAGATPNIPELQRDLAKINTETGDRSVTPILGAGPRPGTVNLTLKVEDHLPVRAGLEINNQYTADTTRLRATASLGYDNLFNRLDSISLQYQTAPEETAEVGVLAASYVTRWGEERRNRLAFSFIDSDSAVAALGTFGVLGKGKIYGAQLIFPLVNDANATHSLTFGAAYKDFRETIQLEKDSFDTPISYLGFTLGHSSVWRVPKGEWTLDSSVNFGARRAFNGDEEFANKRFRARPNYFYLRATGGYRRGFGDWIEGRVRLGGQYAVEPIIANEQFAIGGADTVRGYLEAAELGDIGVNGSIELGLQPYRLFADRLLAEAFLFYDAGIATAIEPLPDEVRRVDLSSAGIGLNFGFADHYAASVSWAYPLVPSGRTDTGDSRFLFMMRSSW